MSGLEIPGFIVGLSGLLSVFETSFEVWRTIREAQGYGTDVADWMCRLEMEFFRFQTWWTALEHLSVTRQRRQSSLGLPAETSAMQTLLRAQCQPIITAAQNVLKQLEQIEEILKRNGVLTLATDHQTQQLASDAGRILDIRAETTSARDRTKRLAKDLMKHTPWYSRLAYNKSPWKDKTDRDALEDNLKSIMYWNDALASILPQNMRDSILQLGIAGFVLEADDNVHDVARSHDGRNSVVSHSARFMAIRQRFKEKALLDLDLQQKLLAMRKRAGEFRGINLTQVSSGIQYSILEYIPEDGMQPCFALTEWIPFPKGDYADLELARTRLSQLSYSLQQVQELSTLFTLPPLGFLELQSGYFGLISTLPSGWNRSTRVATLHEILARKAAATAPGPTAKPRARPLDYPLPTLQQRFDLANTLSMSFYTFLLTNWHHERFGSLHIAFLLNEHLSPSTSSSHSSRPLDLQNPIIGGFAISRPNSIDELSISAAPTDQECFYLHPDIRRDNTAQQSSTAQAPAVTTRPRFQQIYDIYAFGLLLAEIGFWGTISRIAEAGSGGKIKADALPAEEFRAAVINRCRTDLACWMGEKYRDVALRCLCVGETGGIQIQSGSDGLTSFYHNVVIDLASFS